MRDPNRTNTFSSSRHRPRTWTWTWAWAFGLVLIGHPLLGSDEPAITFLTPDQARVAIVDESVEPYYSLLQTQEMACKTGEAMPAGSLASQRVLCRQRYANAVGRYSDDEQKAIRGILATVVPQLQAHYPLFAAEPWTFIKLDARFEGGMPFTRGRCIVMSDFITMGLLATASLPVGQNQAEVLVHEQTHVLQRLHPAVFARLYTDVLGFTHLPQEPARSAELIAHQLLNPDGIACVWAYPVEIDGSHVLIEPQLILGSDATVPRMPDDFAVIALPLDAQGGTYHERIAGDGKAVMMDLESIRSYVQAFAPCDENFHPNEISAVLFAQLVVNDAAGMPETRDSPAMHGVRAWAATGLSRATDQPIAAPGN